MDADRNATKLNGILFLIMGVVFLAIAIGIKWKIDNKYHWKYEINLYKN